MPGSSSTSGGVLSQIPALLSQVPAVAEGRLRSLAGLRAVGLDLAFDDAAEHHVLQAGLVRSEEELGAVRVGAGARHGQDSSARVLEAVVVELVAVDGLPSGPVVVREDPALAHEARDEPAEQGALVANALLPRALLPGVLLRSGDHVGAQLHHDASQRLAPGRGLEDRRSS